jgi:hypothetical protein
VGGGGVAIAASDALLGDYFLYCDGQPRLLFTENETNNERLFGTANPTPHVKDAINDCIVKRSGTSRRRRTPAVGRLRRAGRSG